jgi:hypothetical protein
VIRSAVGVLAFAFALAHVPFIVSTLEDIDSVNFALGVRDFDVADHRPHPPGYPLYIAFGKVAVAVSGLVGGVPAQSAIEARALSALSLVGALLAIVLLYYTWRAFARHELRAVAATALTASCPLFWYLSVRPMSDVPGLAAALAAQACLALAWWRQQPDAGGDRRLSPERMTASGQMIVLGALLSGLAIGFRSQNAMLTLPFLAGVLLDRTGRGVAGAMLGSAVALVLGGLAWGVPLLIASGGLNAYLAALGSQAGEDFAGVDMLYLNPAPRLAAFALLRTLIYPWDSLFLGGVIVGLAALGAVALLRRDPRTLAAVTLMAAPYLVFHLLFHDTNFVRYALPLVPPVAYLAVVGLECAGRRLALPIAGALALWAISIAAPVLAGYASEQSPTVRALDAIAGLAATNPPGALAMHQTFRRPLQAEQLSVPAPILASPPRREWLELTRYWREGHTAPVWFLADPRRTDLALVDPSSRATRQEFTWAWQSLNDLGGMRPAAVHWYRMPAPGWFAEEGWALTPETAGVARLMGRSPSIGPISAWVRRRAVPVQVLVGGRHLGTPADPAVTFALAIDGVDVHTWQSNAGFFLEDFELPAGRLAGEGLAHLTIRAMSREGSSVPTAIEQFDLQSSGALMWGYDEGWYEAEFNPGLGVWRWTSERALLRILNAHDPVAVTLTVEPPQRYFDAPPTVRVRAGEQVVAETNFAEETTWRVVVPADVLQRAGGRLAIETNRTFVPADMSGQADQRQLGLRVFHVNVAFEH